MIPSQSDAYKYALCMELKHNEFRYSFIDVDSQEVAFYEAVNFDSFDEESLKELLDETYFKFTYQSVSLSVSTPRTTLVPDAIFNNSNPQSLFELNHLKPIDNLDYSRIPELGLVSIYEIPLFIKSVFVKQFIRIKILHHSTVLIKGMFNQSTFKLKAHIYIENELFYLAITNRNKLEYFNLFESKAVADIVYYYLFILDQKELDINDVPLHLYGLELSDDIVKQINDLLPKPIIISDSNQLNENFMLQNQLLCV